MIIADRDDVDKNIHVLISQVLGIDPKTNVMSDVSTSLSQLDNNTENPRDNPDVHAPTLFPEKSQDKERSKDITNELGNNDKNHIDQPNDFVNIEELDSDDVPIGKRLVLGISKGWGIEKAKLLDPPALPKKLSGRKLILVPLKDGARWLIMCLRIIP